MIDFDNLTDFLNGPGYTVNREIHRWLFGAPTIVTTGYDWGEDSRGWWMLSGQDQRVPPKRITPLSYLQSFDAAMTLVPEGWRWFKGGDGNEGVKMFVVGPLIFEGELPIFKEIMANETIYDAAKALCAAALKAQNYLRLKKETTNDQLL